ncbi:MAG: phosphonate C-P lyase system protein PhnL [Oceanidesulfovibrio sp.]
MPHTAPREHPVLLVRNLSKSFYLHEQSKRIPSACGVHLAVHPRRLTALVGPTGSGKSSVLKAIYRSYLPGAGEILYRGADGLVHDLASLDDHGVIRLRNAEISFVTQFLQALPRQPTMDVVAQPLYKKGLGREEGREAACRMLARLSIPKRLWSLPPSTFSGGERQRVNLARGVIGRPRLLLLDEPTASLDPTTTDVVVELIEEVKSWGSAILAVFHSTYLVERLADNVVRLDLPMEEPA